jgi:hypothetical protein
MHESKGEPFDPKQNGFVFTTAEIAAHLQARAKRDFASKAYQYLNA